MSPTLLSMDVSPQGSVKVCSFRPWLFGLDVDFLVLE